MDLNKLTIQEANEGLRNGNFSSVELLKACLESVKANEKKIGAFLNMTENEALEQAQAADEKIAGGEELGLIEGIPIAIKDNMLHKGHIVTAGSKILEDYNSVYDATAVRKLKEAGAVIIGQTNLDEFAMGTSTENSAFKKTKNPWNIKCVPGGSSGGSAAAVSADMCFAALGSDTGGSVRQPASFCGVTGLKPTYGRVSRYGLIAMASSLDQIGTIAKNVQDAAWMLRAIEGIDEMDSTSVNVEPVAAEFPEDIKGIKIGVPKEFFGAGLDSGVREKVEFAIKKFEGLGAEIRELELKHAEYALAVYYIIMPSEVSSNMARYDGVRYGKREKGKNLLEVYMNTRGKNLGEEVRRRIILGTHTLSSGYYDAYYGRAQKVRTIIRNEYINAFKEVDCIVGPTAPTTAFKLGEMVDDPLAMYLSDIYTVSANVAGLPGLSIPCGFHEGMPVGLQIMGNYFDENTILRVGNALQATTEYYKEKPEL